MAEHLIGKQHATASFSAAHPPVLRVVAGAGDRITVETDDEAYAQMEATRDLAAVTATLNPVTGPVFVEGAEPGDALAVTVHDITPGEQGWSVYLPGVGALARPMGEEMFVRRIPLRDGRAHLAQGLAVPVRPMIGCIGVAPASSEASTVMPSYPTGGNTDLTDVAPGATAYLPVQVEGALLSIGDLHAVMSRGESSFVAIEVAGTATVSVDVVKGLHLRAPRVDTGREVVCVGLGDPVQASITAAYEDLFAHLVDERGWDRGDAYVAMSAEAHTELGGPTGSRVPDPLHPLTPVGAVTLARMAHEVVDALATRPARRP
ncbi:acetamidase/formamidase family protein [Quadrisphaera sp. DSM 44207]|uniref:acetamidase/formamidase family protein n=1 Tax=Quadrisphaera sp. DSM 44207 TaxID=1881057 RepID=UPI000883DDDC|nr:acetamidase/formamidase family protein [Quadrisphaera sp. DSM 44207]SDQ62266.1 amidase [Quadrisphaera sp. DSM 44207]